MTETASTRSGAPHEGEHAPEARVAGQLRSLMTIAAAVSASRRFLDFVELVATETCAVLGASSVSISLFEREQRHLRTLVNVGDLAEWEQTRPDDEIYHLDDYPEVARCLEGGLSYIDVLDEPGSSAHELLVRLGKQSAVGVPIWVDGQAWGELYATTAEGTRRFNPSDLAFMERVAEQLGKGAAEAQRVSKLDTYAYTDGLTGLANRRAFEERLVAMTERDPPVALVLLDVDDLKVVNDHHGHEAGDALLARVGAVLRESAESVHGATAHRLGGDEFCLLLAGHDGVAAERVARAVAGRLAAQEEEISVSCGVAADTTGELSGDELLRRADHAQYQAKRSGRGAVVVSAGPNDEGAGGESRELARRATDVTRVLDRVLGCLDELPPVCGPLERLRVTATMLTELLGLRGWVLWRISEADEAVSERLILDHGPSALAPDLADQLAAATQAAVLPCRTAVFEARLVAGGPDRGQSFCLVAARTETSVLGLTLAPGQSGVFSGLASALRLLVLAAVKGGQG
ncbi:MAG: diguanylate cyclase domain-containing protein [Egibacteraceae bacterium]